MVTGTERQTTQVRIASGLNTLAGVWLVVAPSILGFAALENAFWNSVITGTAVTVIGLIRMIKPLQSEWLSRVTIMIGMWVAVSPFVLGFAEVGSAMWNAAFTGIIILALATWSSLCAARPPADFT